MATLTAELVEVIDKLIEKVREGKDVYAEVFIGYEGVKIDIFPYILQIGPSGEYGQN